MTGAETELVTGKAIFMNNFTIESFSLPSLFFMQNAQNIFVVKKNKLFVSRWNSYANTLLPSKSKHQTFKKTLVINTGMRKIFVLVSSNTF